MAESGALLAVTVLIICCGTQVKSDSSNHRYKAGDSVPFYANKVGSFHNPSETYAYFDLPFCLPDHVKEKKLTLGEVLNGDRLVSAPYKLEFLVDKDFEVLCRKRLTKEEVSRFRSAVVNDFFQTMLYDELPIRAFIGNIHGLQKSDPKEYRYFIFRHTHFEILYNKDRVIEINTRIDPHYVADVTEDKEIDVEFLYTVKWRETSMSFDRRMEKFSTTSWMPQYFEPHWSAIRKSCAAVLILISCLLIFYVQVLKKEISKYADDDEVADNQEETGWKYIHGDVFRFPKHRSLFAAALGSGTQLLTLMVFIIIQGLLRVFKPYDRGSLLSTLVIVFALTSGIAGCTAVSLYYQLEGTNWVRNLLLTGGLFSGPLCLTFCFLNTIAISYGASAALPLGEIAGKNSGSEFQPPCPTTDCPREIPPLRWYRGIIPQMALAGILPFGVIYVELHSIFSSVWGHRLYNVYNTICIAVVILLIVTALVSITLMYSQLASEDHEWWWRSFLRGGSTGLFIYGYCFYFYFERSAMRGLMQTSFFFGYMACVCFGIFLMLGSVGFRASLLFVRHIYGSIKSE